MSEARRDYEDARAALLAKPCECGTRVDAGGGFVSAFTEVCNRCRNLDELEAAQAPPRDVRGDRLDAASELVFSLYRDLEQWCRALARGAHVDPHETLQDLGGFAIRVGTYPFEQMKKVLHELHELAPICEAAPTYDPAEPATEEPF